VASINQSIKGISKSELVRKSILQNGAFGVADKTWNNDMAMSRPTVLNMPIHGGMARLSSLSWLCGLVEYQEGIPANGAVTHLSTNPAQHRIV